MPRSVRSGSYYFFQVFMLMLSQCVHLFSFCRDVCLHEGIWASDRTTMPRNALSIVIAFASVFSATWSSALAVEKLIDVHVYEAARFIITILKSV